MHSFIHLSMHSFIHCISVWVGSTWFDPPHPFQIGRGPLGTAASSLPTFPSSLSWSWDERSQRVKYWSPAPFPHSSRGQPPRDGGTLLPLDHPTHHHPVSFTVFGCCFQFYQRVLPACMHHSASASVQLSETTSCRRAALNRRCCCGCWHHHRWWWWWQRRWRCCVELQNALWTMKDETPRCSLAVALTSKPHLSHQDFFASTNRIGCSVRSDITEASLCVCFFLFFCFILPCSQMASQRRWLWQCNLIRNAWFWFPVLCNVHTRCGSNCPWLQLTGVPTGLQFGRTERRAGKRLWRHAGPFWAGGSLVRESKVGCW